MKLLHEFGRHPVAGYLVENRAQAEAAPRCTAALSFCEVCTHVQQATDESRELLVDLVYSQYQATYSSSRHVSSYVDSFVRAAAKLAAASPGDLFVEIGSNDGAVLELIERLGFRAVGIEPASNLAEIGKARGLAIVNDFLSEAVAEEVRSTHGPARVVLSRHTLEHAFEPVEFLKSISKLLAADGVAIIEVPYLPHQMLNGHFEAMTFQHMSFFGVNSMSEAFRRAGLRMMDVHLVPMDGGSMVAIGSRSDAPPVTTTRHVTALETLERASGLASIDAFATFFRRVEQTGQTARALLKQLKNEGATCAGYGAGSKGQSLVNFMRLTADDLPIIIDDTPTNEGRFVPGPGMEVVSSGDERALRAEVVLVTAPTHSREIVAKARRQWGDSKMYFGTIPDLHLMHRDTL
jgi:SAM-dependent methyltransferase